jgi:hypothetical protein
MGRTELADPATGAAAVRRAGRARVALGFLAAQLVAMLAADALLGPRGLGWYRGPGTARAVGLAFALLWAFLVWLELARGRAWPRALLAALPLALGSAGIAAVVMRLLGR